MDTAARRAAARAKEEEAAPRRETSERVRAPRAAAERHETGPVAPDPDHGAPDLEIPDAPVEAAAPPTARPRSDADPAARERADRERSERAEAARARAEVEAALEAQAAREAEIMAMVEADELARAVEAVAADSEDVASDESPLDETRRRTRERLAAHAEDDALASARRQRDDRAARRRSDAGDDAPETFSWDQPLGRRLRLPWLRRREEAKAPAAPEPLPLGGDPLKLDRLGDARPVDRTAAAPVRVSPAPRPALFAADVGLNSASLPPGDPAKTKRAREAFATLGYRVEGLAHGQLMLHADFGRRFERILVHVLPDDQRLDWAALLARRREAGATHLAVVGDQRDLHRLVAPADLAKSTLWSWAGLDRVLELAAAMPIGPFDLEGHFERDGLYEYGLDRFERSIAKRVQERGAFSAVLERLAMLKAPAVFLLEDVAGSADVPREQALRVLERLAEAPWHLVSRIDSGEFCLRFRVHDALDQIGAYAASLRVRLPERQRDRVRGLPDDIDPIDAADVPAPAEAPQGVAAAAEAPAEAGETVAVPAARLRPGARAPAEAEAKPAPPSRLFAGPGLGAEEEAETDEVDVSLVSNPRNRRRR
jgi:chemotaxis protein histidine kinase CheA